MITNLGEALLKMVNLTESQQRVLEIIREHGECGFTDITKRIKSSSSTVRSALVALHANWIISYRELSGVHKYSEYRGMDKSEMTSIVNNAFNILRES